MPKPNPNRIDRQKKQDSPPPRDQGRREAPGDQTDWESVGHAEAEAQRRTGDAAPASSGEAAGGTRPKRPRAEPGAP
jgi:hypothetical protein